MSIFESDHHFFHVGHLHRSVGIDQDDDIARGAHEPGKTCGSLARRVLANDDRVWATPQNCLDRTVG